jgi:hypothetical protein
MMDEEEQVCESLVFAVADDCTEDDDNLRGLWLLTEPVVFGDFIGLWGE